MFKKRDWYKNWEKEMERKKWEAFNKATVATGCTSCDACPYVVYGEHGERRCYLEDYENCVGEHDNEEA